MILCFSLSRDKYDRINSNVIEIRDNLAMSIKYFERPCSEWNIVGFLSECDERQFNEFDENISYYISCLETISKEEGLRSKKAQDLLDRYRKASTGFLGVENGWQRIP